MPSRLPPGLFRTVLVAGCLSATSFAVAGVATAHLASWVTRGNLLPPGLSLGGPIAADGQGNLYLEVEGGPVRLPVGGTATTQVNTSPINIKIMAADAAGDLFVGMESESPSSPGWYVGVIPLGSNPSQSPVTLTGPGPYLWIFGLAVDAAGTNVYASVRTAGGSTRRYHHPIHRPRSHRL